MILAPLKSIIVEANLQAKRRRRQLYAGQAFLGLAGALFLWWFVL